MLLLLSLYNNTILYYTIQYYRCWFKGFSLTNLKWHILPCKLFINVVFMTDNYSKEQKESLFLSQHAYSKMLFSSQEDIFL